MRLVKRTREENTIEGGAELSKSRGNLTPCRRVCGAKTSPTCGLWHLLNLILASSPFPTSRVTPSACIQAATFPEGGERILPRWRIYYYSSISLCLLSRDFLSSLSISISAIYSFPFSFPPSRIRIERFPTTCFDFDSTDISIKGTEIHPVEIGVGLQEGGMFFLRSERRR